MNSKSLNIIFFIVMLAFVEGGAQSKVFDFDKGIVWRFSQIEDSNFFRTGIDTLTGDMIKIMAESFVRINNLGDTIELMQFDKCLWSKNCSDDGYNFSGHYKEFYNSGQLKRVGNVVCNQKEGEWMIFFENGNISKYENYELFEITLGHRTPYLSGVYKEYHPSGQVKISGMYRVLQKWTEVSSINIESYEIKSECCRWVTTSIKYGTWREYDIEGHLVNQADYQLDIDESSIYRDLPDKILTQK